MDLTFEQHGAGDAVVFVHGFPLDHTQWVHQIEGVEGWRRVAPDLRGAGGSAVGAGPHSMAVYAEDLVKLLDRLGIERAVWCGLSLGGYVLFEVMRRWPERVRGLVLCDTKAEADTEEGKRGRDDLAALARRDGPGAVAERLVPRLLGSTTRTRAPELEEAVRAVAQRMPVPGIVEALRAMRDRPDSNPLLGTIAVPTLVLCGAEDEITPPAGMRAMAARIPGARFAEVADAGHLAPLEQPRRFNAQLRKFLEGV